MQSGQCRAGRRQVFAVHQTFGLPFFAQRSTRDHRTRTRVVGDREVYAFEYLPEVVRPGSALTELAESLGIVTYLGGLATRLSRGVQPFLVTDDFFGVLPRLLGLPPAQVQLPADTDPHDGRRWAAYGDAGLIESALVPQVWELLDGRGPGPAMSLFTRGDWLLWLPNQARGRRLAAHADLLAAVAALLEGELDAGMLDPWTTDGLDPLRHWLDTDFHVIAPIRSVLFYLWSLRSMENLGEMVRGRHAGVDFIAVDALRPAVLVALEHRVPDHVLLARSRLFAGRGVDTEWQDFNRDYVIAANNARVGHAVATPRLIQYLYDHDIDRIDVLGPWVSAQAADFTPTAIRHTVEVLARAREFLPSFPVADYAAGAG